MSARRHRATRSRPRPDPEDDLDLRLRAQDVRSEWLGHALSTAPADRPAAEAAVTELYACLGRPRPAFCWVASPAAALRATPPATGPVTQLYRSVAGQLAGLLSDLRSSLDERVAHAGVAAVVEAQVGAPLRRTVRESVAGTIRGALPGRTGLVRFGQHDADLVARYDALRRVAGVSYRAADADRLASWATLVRSCGWWWPREDRCVIAERPSAIRTEPVPGSTDLRLHDGDGPSVTFRDGWSVHSWHGTPVPSWVIESPRVEWIAAERNVEVRRCAIERIGWAAFIAHARLTLVGRAADPGNPGRELRLYDLPWQQWGAPTRLLLAVNGSRERDGTRRRYGLRVPPWFDDPIDAAGWSYGLTGAQYAQLQRRT